MANIKSTSQSDCFKPSLSDSLRQEYLLQQRLFEAQPPILQRFLEVQARQVAEAFVARVQRVRFTLPDKVNTGVKDGFLPVPEGNRQQVAGRLSDRLSGRDVHTTLRQVFSALESSTDQATALSGGLIRFVSAQHIIHNMLPSGRSVTYGTPEDEEIPCIPMGGLEPDSAITADTDAIAEESSSENGRGNLQVPYVPVARKFYLPQWVAFNEEGNLLVNSIEEAEAHIASMQKFLEVLFAARSLAPYMVADDEFEKKRYGMLGQLVNQGRALANHMTQSTIATIKKRASEQSLNRGLGLRLPFFDDQDLRIEYHSFVVIPAGRIMFVPAFVVRSAQEEQAKIAQDTRFSSSSRKYLMQELASLEMAFKQPERNR